MTSIENKCRKFASKLARYVLLHCVQFIIRFHYVLEKKIKYAKQFLYDFTICVDKNNGSILESVDFTVEIYKSTIFVWTNLYWVETRQVQNAAFS